MARCIMATSLLAAAGICSITCLTGLVACPIPSRLTLHTARYQRGRSLPSRLMMRRKSRRSWRANRIC